MISKKLVQRIALVLLSCAAAVIPVSCAKSSNTSGAASITCNVPAQDVILSYTHSADYATYKLDWVEKSGNSYALKANQISLSSGGLRSPTFLTNYFLVADSSATGRLLVYSRATNTLAGQINVGSFLQDMVIVNNIAYIANGATGTNLLKRVDVSNLPSLTLLSDITVGGQPSVVRCYNGKVYVGNQDWTSKSQATVSIIDPSTNTVTGSFNTGPNNVDIAYDGARIWTQNVDWYNASFVCQNSSTLTYTSVFTTTPVSVTVPTGYTTSSNCSKGGIAFNNTTGYVSLRHTSGNFHLFSISGATVSSTAADSTNTYKFVGSGGTYLYKIHNGNGSTSSLTTIIEDMSGSVLTTQTLTKDSDMYFFANN